MRSVLPRHHSPDSTSQPTESLNEDESPRAGQVRNALISEFDCDSTTVPHLNMVQNLVSNYNRKHLDNVDTVEALAEIVKAYSAPQNGTDPIAIGFDRGADNALASETALLRTPFWLALLPRHWSASWTHRMILHFPHRCNLSTQLE